MTSACRPGAARAVAAAAMQAMAAATAMAAGADGPGRAGGPGRRACLLAPAFTPSPRRHLEERERRLLAPEPQLPRDGVAPRGHRIRSRRRRPLSHGREQA